VNTVLHDRRTDHGLADLEAGVRQVKQRFAQYVRRSQQPQMDFFDSGKKRRAEPAAVRVILALPQDGDDVLRCADPKSRRWGTAG
jgi:hypothetical protein